MGAGHPGCIRDLKERKREGRARGCPDLKRDARGDEDQL